MTAIGPGVCAQDKTYGWEDTKKVNRISPVPEAQQLRNEADQFNQEAETLLDKACNMREQGKILDNAWYSIHEQVTVLRYRAAEALEKARDLERAYYEKVYESDIADDKEWHDQHYDERP